MYVSNQLPVKLFSYALNAILGLAQNCQERKLYLVHAQKLINFAKKLMIGSYMQANKLCLKQKSHAINFVHGQELTNYLCTVCINF